MNAFSPLPAATQTCTTVSMMPGDPPAVRSLVGLLPGLLLVTLLAGCGNLSPLRAVRIASASTSQTLCTAAFVSRLDADAAYRDEVRPAGGMGLIAWALRYRVDAERREVTTDIAGMARRVAIFREGMGCAVALGDVPPLSWVPPTDRPTPVDPFPGLAAPGVVAPTDPRLARAIDEAFAEPSAGPPRRTQAVVVVHRGKLLAERYSADVSASTLLPSHSLAKSVTHALIGVLVHQGRLDPDRPAPVPEWARPGDPRGTITPNQLLAMASGLPWDERHGGWDEATRLWFDEPDPYAYAVSEPLATAPGQHWAYSNLGYTVLSRLLRDLAGNQPTALPSFAQRELFEPIGIRNAVITLDRTATPQGSNLVLASARDWARLGLLYLNEGRVGNRQILPPDWTKAARTPTLDAGYGRGFWLNHTDAPHPLPGRWGMPGAPADAYFARGYLGQFIVIVPSLDLVVVRLGISYRAGGDIATVGRMVGEIAAVLAGR